MITTVKTSERRPASSFVNLSRMDYELVCNVLRLLEDTGMDDEELSFLLGKRKQYFANLIDPRKKGKLKTDQVDPLAAILGKSHRQIIPLTTQPGEMTQLHHATRKEDKENGTVTYSHILYPPDGGHGTRISWEKTTVKGVRYKVNPALSAFLEAKVAGGYFSKPRLALPLYLEMKQALRKERFTGLDLERALAKLLRGDGKLMSYGIRDLQGVTMGFMGLAAEKVEMLFIHPDHGGRGLGAFLMAKAIKLKGKPLYVDVNEQNEAATRFYARMGFRAIGRSELDATGQPFPIVHMALDLAEAPFNSI